MQYQGDQYCRQCLPSFTWYNNSYCRFESRFCLSYSNISGICNNCQSFARNFTQNHCVPDYCSFFDFAAGRCTSCSSGYTLAFHRCFRIIINCSTYAPDGTCSLCANGYSYINGVCQRPQVPNCFYPSPSSCDRCLYRYYRNDGYPAAETCFAYPQYCINIDPLGNCISCCFGSNLVNGRCVKENTILNCKTRVDNYCAECKVGYIYCQFCDACLPQDPNCEEWNVNGTCKTCITNFHLIDNICKSKPVGYVSGSQTCRSGYTQNGTSCYRNANTLRPLSSKNIFPSTSTLTPISFTNSVVVKNFISFNTMVIFGIQISNNVGPISFVIYFRNKPNTPHICWNSCIPTSITTGYYSKSLNFPIVASEVNVYLYGANANTNVDFQVLP